MTRTVASVISNLPSPHTPPLKPPEYTGEIEDTRTRLGMAVYSMSEHTSNEGYEIFRGLESNGYVLTGHRYPNGATNTQEILKQFSPGVVVMQDQREWERNGPKDFRDPRDKFTQTYHLSLYPDIFKLTIIKDAHQRLEYHSQSAATIGCHAWITYYHPDIVCHLAPYVRKQHLIRTWHTIDADTIPPFTPKDERQGALLSGAISNAYPLRQVLKASLRQLPLTTHLPHPGYHRNGCETPKYLKTLSKYRIAICTTSVYGYSLRKLIEATAAGCVVLTNLPIDDQLPWIDGNLVRIPERANIRDIGDLIRDLYAGYNEDLQRHYADLARIRYDYRVVTKQLAEDIEHLRQTYNGVLQITSTIPQTVSTTT